MSKRKLDEMPFSTPDRILGFIRAYDYHNHIKGYKTSAFLALSVLLPILAALEYPFTPFGILFILSIFLLIGLFLIVTLAILGQRRLEIGEEGLQYRGFGKKIKAPWSDIRKVRREGSRCSTVFTDAGKFCIDANLEPADSPTLPWTKTILKDIWPYYNELLEEIRRRAPNSQWTIEPLYALFKKETSHLIRESWMPTLRRILSYILLFILILAIGAILNTASSRN